MDLTFLTSPSFIAYYVVRSIFMVISTLLLFGIVYLLFATGYLKTRWIKDLIELFSQQPYGLGGPARKWRKIKGYLQSEEESKIKLAVIEADNLLSEVLEKMGYEEEKLEQQLEQVPQGRISNPEEVKQVHQLRNNVAYDPDYQLDKEQAQQALEAYEECLQELRAF